MVSIAPPVKVKRISPALPFFGSLFRIERMFPLGWITSVTLLFIPFNHINHCVFPTSHADGVRHIVDVVLDDSPPLMAASGVAEYPLRRPLHTHITLLGWPLGQGRPYPPLDASTAQFAVWVGVVEHTAGAHLNVPFPCRLRDAYRHRHNSQVLSAQDSPPTVVAEAGCYARWVIDNPFLRVRSVGLDVSAEFPYLRIHTPSLQLLPSTPPLTKLARLIL